MPHSDGRPPPEDPSRPGEPSDPTSVARIICLRLLTERARTRAELAATLRRRGVPDEAAEVVLDRFVDVGLIDDVEVAENYALVQHRQRGLAARAVAGKLRRRGVDEDTIRTALTPIDATSELTVAYALATRKLPSLRHLEPSVQARRLYGLLARRGYPASVATTVVARTVRHVGDNGTEMDEWLFTDESGDSGVSE
jgi:regulatory protein